MRCLEIGSRVCVCSRSFLLRAKFLEIYPRVVDNSRFALLLCSDDCYYVACGRSQLLEVLTIAVGAIVY